MAPIRGSNAYGLRVSCVSDLRKNSERFETKTITDIYISEVWSQCML